METKFERLAKKLHALSEHGVGGEKTNAEQALKRLMKKHGIKMADIEGDKVEQYGFTVPAESRKLFMQIAVMVMGRDVQIYTIKGHRNLLMIRLTEEQYISIELQFRHYVAAFEKEKKALLDAFIQVNRLFPEPTDEEVRTNKTQEELDAMFKMMDVIEETPFMKHLTR
jgi:hypothetical protein